MKLAHPYSLAGIAALVLAGALNIVTFVPPLQDFNEWIYQGYLVAALLRGEDVPFAFKSWPVPNAAVQVLLGGLNLMLTPRVAGLAYLTCYLAGFGWLAWHIADRPGGFDPATFLLVIVVGVLNSPYWDGYANYQLGVALLLWHVVRQRRDGGTGAWSDAVMGVAIFFCHAVVLAVFALLVGGRALLERRLLRGVLVLAPPMLLLAWYVAVDDNYGEYIPPIGETPREFLLYKIYSLAKAGPYQNMVISGVGDQLRAPGLYLTGVLTNLGFALLALLPLGVAAGRDVLRGRPTGETLTILCCLAAFVVLPSALFGVVNIGERFLLPGLLIALAVTSDPWRLRRLGASLALMAPALVVYFHLIMPGAPAAPEIDHQAINDRAQRFQLLFWHRPFQFHAQIAAAQRGEAVRLGFTTSLLVAR